MNFVGNRRLDLELNRSNSSSLIGVKINLIKPKIEEEIINAQL